MNTERRVDGARSVAVLGLGNSGRAVIDLVDRLGGRSFATDDRVGAVADGLPASCTVVSPAETAKVFADVAGVVTSPGIAKGHRLLIAAEDAGLPILSEPAFAAQYISAPLLAVTGTNGKSTTVSLLGNILQAAGRRCFVGGNLGRPLCEAAGQDWDACVVELSSFQLEWPGALRPAIAAILNLSPDHLDRHGDMDTYARTKLALARRMTGEDWLVLSRTDRWWDGLLDDVSARIATFGPGAPDASMPGLAASPRSRTLHGEDGWRVEFAEGWPENPFDWDNVAAAAEMARRFGISATAIRDGVESFVPLAHRLTRVGTHRSVEYWNDSKATNVGAALRSVEAFDRPVILLAGGVAKGAQFDALAACAGIKRIVAYGEAGADIAAAAGRSGVCVAVCEDLAGAFADARAAAQPGDVVLLAPACASFDQFSDYADRGRAFEAMVAALATGS